MGPWPPCASQRRPTQTCAGVPPSAQRTASPTPLAAAAAPLPGCPPPLNPAHSFITRAAGGRRHRPSRPGHRLHRARHIQVPNLYAGVHAGHRHHVAPPA